MPRYIDTLPFVLMRGGTSKGVFLKEGTVPSDRQTLTPVLLDIMGSPDRRQIDGMGGSDKLTSKAGIIGKPTRSGTDVTFLFGQVGVWANEVDYALNCGNLTSAVGMYAIEEGFVAPREGTTSVRVHNINTDKVITVDVPVKNGIPVTKGDFAIAGVPGTGAPIGLDFGAAAGARTGKLLPLGAPTVGLKVEELGSVPVSVVDMANLVIFVRAESLGMVGIEGPDEIDQDVDLLLRINAVRREVAYAVGMREYWDSSEVKGSPTLVVVHEPKAYKHFGTGEDIAASAMHMVGRLYGSGSTSRAYAGGSTACTGVACRIPGTIPNQIVSDSARYDEPILIGHPTGTIPVDAFVERVGDEFAVRYAKIYRTARRLAEGKLLLKQAFAMDA